MRYLKNAYLAIWSNFSYIKSGWFFNFGRILSFRESFSNRFWVSLWGIRPIVIINLGKRDTDFLEARCKYAFGKVEAKIGLGFEVGLKSLNREEKEKDKDNKKKGWEVGLNFDVSLGCEVNVPIYLDSESINRRDLEIYKTFVEVPAFGFTGEVELSAIQALNFQIPGFNVKQSEKYGLNLGDYWVCGMFLCLKMVFSIKRLKLLNSTSQD